MDLPLESDFPQKEMLFTRDFIRQTARSMIGKAGLLAADVPDIQQDLWVDLLERMPKYKPDRGPIRAFIRKVVRNGAATILAARRAEKRRGEIGMLSLNEEFEDEDGETTELHEAISVDDYLRRTRGTIRTECERMDLAIDIRQVLSFYPPHIAVICLLLIDSDESAVANVVGLPRSTFRDLLGRLREERVVGGLRKYFK